MYYMCFILFTLFLTPKATRAQRPGVRGEEAKPLEAGDISDVAEQLGEVPPFGFFPGFRLP